MFPMPVNRFSYSRVLTSVRVGDMVFMSVYQEPALIATRSSATSSPSSESESYEGSGSDDHDLSDIPPSISVLAFSGTGAWISTVVAVDNTVRSVELTLRTLTRSPLRCSPFSRSLLVKSWQAMITTLASSTQRRIKLCFASLTPPIFPHTRRRGSLHCVNHIPHPRQCPSRWVGTPTRPQPSLRSARQTDHCRCSAVRDPAVCTNLNLPI